MLHVYFKKFVGKPTIVNEVAVVFVVVDVFDCCLMYVDNNRVGNWVGDNIK